MRCKYNLSLHTERAERPAVISLYDFTGEAVRPWAKFGYRCHCFDIQHKGIPEVEVVGRRGGSITYHKLDLHDFGNLLDLRFQILQLGMEVVFGMAFPVCTDLAVSGAKHFAKKEKENPGFQRVAAGYAEDCAMFFDAIGCPYFIENPVSVLSTLWRKPDYTFHPYEYGAYIPYWQAEHPRWPEHIAPRDAYPKKTCLWTGGGFVMPDKMPVPVEDGYSRQFKKLGGKSKKTKDIRSATPRGFARAVLCANNPMIPTDKE